MPRRLSGNLHAPGDFAARVRAAVQEACEHNSDPVKQQYIIDSGKGLCNVEALARFETLDEDQRVRVLSKVDVWRGKLLQGEVKRARWRDFLPYSDAEQRRVTARVSASRRRDKAQKKAAEGTGPEEEGEEASPASQPRLVDSRRQPPRRGPSSSQLRPLFPAPRHEGPSSSASLGAAHPPFAEPSPLFGETWQHLQRLHPAAPLVQPDHFPQQASRTYAEHDYQHDPTIFCPSCDPFDEPPSFVPPPPAAAYHPAPREQGSIAPHVLHRPFGEGDGHEQRRYGER